MDRILHLTNNNELNNLDMIRKCIQTKPVIIFMVAPWCGHCQRLEPTIDTLEKEMIDEPQYNKLHIIKIHDEYIPKLNLPEADLNVDSYPTIRMLSNGTQISDHKGDRNSKSIKDFISNNLNISRNSRPLKPNKISRNSISKKRKSIASRHSKPVDGDILKTYKFKKNHKCKNNKGPGSKDPNWLKKTFNLKGGKKKGKKKSKKKNTKKKKKTKRISKK